MRNILIGAFFAGLFLFVQSCNKTGTPVPPGSYRIAVEDLVTDNHLMIKRATITAKGKKMVRVTETGSLEEATIDADAENGMMTAELLLVANIITPSNPSESLMTWLKQIKGSGVTVGGPGIISIGSAKKIGDVMKINLLPGDYPLDQTLEIGSVQGQKVVLTVK